MYELLIFILTIIILFFIINILISKKEHFCKINKTTSVGTINDKRVLLNYPAQSNIKTSSCDQYWKEWPLESNSNMIENNANIMASNQLELPKEKQFGANDYTKGLIDFEKFATYLSDDVNTDIIEEAEELLRDPLTNKQVEYDYEVKFSYFKLNEKTWVNRWDKYNPLIRVDFPYIESPIENINILNKHFLSKCNDKQRFMLSDEQLLQAGIVPFQIYKYKILKVVYYLDRPMYVIKAMLFRESYLYSNTFSYIGYVLDGIPYIIDVTHIGRNSNDDLLLPDFYNKQQIDQNIINKNYSNMTEINKDPDAVVNILKKQKEDYKIKNQYACFSMNYDPKLGNSNFLPYYSRDTCESNYDPYGKQKEIGLFDSPCKKNEDCPFYKLNKNYPNEFGKCQEDGKCELPVNMEHIGYRYYKNKKYYNPLCYNCDSEDFKVGTSLNDCCNDQYDKKKYPFLKSPDYAFENDFIDRKNFFNSQLCQEKPGTFDVKCRGNLSVINR